MKRTGVWTLDECQVLFDFIGLATYLDLFQIGIGNPPGPSLAGLRTTPTPPIGQNFQLPASNVTSVQFDTRIDVSSRYHQHKGSLDGRVSLADINGAVYKYAAVLAARRQRVDNSTLWWYSADASQGACEDQRLEGLIGMCLAFWSRGATGGLPYWESDASGGRFNLSALAIVVQGTQWPGYFAPLPSVRLKVALSAQQLVEHAALLSRMPGWSRLGVARAICRWASEADSTGVASECQASSLLGHGGLELNKLNYSAIEASQFVTLRQRLAASALLAHADDA